MEYDVKACMNCKHGHIVETSHEWIECHCKLDGEWHGVFSSCDKHEGEGGSNS